MAEIDPTNALLHRQNRFRVEGEIVRDLTLAVAGMLSPKIGGPSVFPPLPPGIAELSYANNFKWNTSAGDDRYRRGMYTFFKRTAPHPNLTTFDCPDSNTTCIVRQTSNTPLQALVTLNNECYVEAAQGLARRLLETAPNDSERLTLGMRLCVARPPTERGAGGLRRVAGDRPAMVPGARGRSQGGDRRDLSRRAWRRPKRRPGWLRRESCSISTSSSRANRDGRIWITRLPNCSPNRAAEFFTTAANGLGAVALGAALAENLSPGEVRAADAAAANPLAPKAPHFAPRAKSCIFIFLEGAPSQIDLFDPKPKLNELHGQKMPESMTKNVRFAFLKKDTATLMGSKRTFTKYGQCGMELSDLLPHLGSVADDILLVRSMHSDQFNHHPGQLLMQCGRAAFGLPTMGSWITYGLGSESRNLPGYIVLACGRGGSGGASLWQSGFLPSVHSGVLFRNSGEPVLNLQTPAGVTGELQRKGLDVLAQVNRQRFEQMHDPEIASRIASYELAFRMQASAPELIDLSGETQATLDMYGLDRKEPDVKASRAAVRVNTARSRPTVCLRGGWSSAACGL